MASKFSTQKNTRLSTSILIYLIKQTSTLKKIHDRSLDPKNTEGINFQPKKTSDLPIMCTASTPLGVVSWARH